MELKGNTAERWEQVSNKLSELSEGLSGKKKEIDAMITSLKQVEKEIDSTRKTLEKLGAAAYKEVLREESGTLNDEAPSFEDVIENEAVNPENTDASTEAEAKEDEATNPIAANQAELPINAVE